MNDYMIYRLALKNGMKPPEKKKPGKIARFSKKRQRANREYAEKSRPLWIGKHCAISAPGCTGTAQGIHHKKGKSSIELLLDERYWIPACNHCNTWCEIFPAEAEKEGFKISRLKK
ncbi:hypothetical protein SAMN05428988_0127 [Chitinophaga sp. YR573]|uniref:hypothetical protein n=1 Tax=Chitinophaga sp. YR573 TaxID=1881040 RepID=UPI0008B7B300|nr:hypothetical protein [Chitinophaga sp. YR573]SEV88638.1 hypothetical protein SAMN05428988_0127 [Chitinophaga sp. YR573]